MKTKRKKERKKKWSLAAICKCSIFHKVHFTEKPELNHMPPALCSCHQSQHLQRGSWNCNSTNSSETFPIQSELSSYIPIKIFTNPSERLHFDQPGKCLWTNQTARSSCSQEDKSIRDQGWGLPST